MPEHTLLKIGAIYHLALCAFHVTFWRLFRWREELGRIGTINRRVMPIMNLTLMAIFLWVGWISWVYAESLLESASGRAFVAGIAAIWLFRCGQQLYFFGLRNPLSQLLTVVFAGGGAIYAGAWWLAGGFL